MSQKKAIIGIILTATLAIAGIVIEDFIRKDKIKQIEIQKQEDIKKREKEKLREEQNEKNKGKIIIECKNLINESFEKKVMYYASRLGWQYIEKTYGKDITKEVKSEEILEKKEGEIRLKIIINVDDTDIKMRKKLLERGKLTRDGSISLEVVFTIEDLGENRILLKDVTDVESLKIDRKSIVRAEEDTEKYKIKEFGYDVVMTFDGGDTWQPVPLKPGDFSSESTNLMEGSYYIKEDIVAFIYGNSEIMISEDRGKTYRFEKLPPINGNVETRRQFIGFTEDGTCYAIRTSGKVMGEEGVEVFISKDKGRSFKKTAGFVTWLVEGVSFVNENEIYIGTKHGVRKSVDGGMTFNDMEIPCRDEILTYYDTLTVPKFNGLNGVMYVSQGDDGDYGEGGEQVAKLITKDGGKNWEYVGEVIL